MIRKYLWAHALKQATGPNVLEDDVIFEKLRAVFPAEWLAGETSVSETNTVFEFTRMASMAGPIKKWMGVE